jgi:hypothetical protein
MEFEEKRQEVLFSRYLRDSACPPEAVSGRYLTDDIIGRWKLIKDRETDTDYSCNGIIYNFQPDSTLTITSDRPDYPTLSADYSYDPWVCAEAPYHPDAFCLTIDGARLSSEVLEKIMFLGDEQNPSAKVFIRIE